MAEMLVRLVDRVNLDDPVKHAQLTKRCDVIVVQEDGWPWTAAELAGDQWLLVKVPGAPASSLSAFTAEEPDDGTYKLLQRRAFSFNLTAYLAMPDQARVKFTQAQVLAMKVAKKPIPDPSVL